MTTDGTLFTSSYILCHLDYFHAKFSSSFCDSESREITIDHPIDIVKVFLDTLSKSNVYIDDDQIFDLYDIADFYQHQKLLDMVIDHLGKQRFTSNLYEKCIMHRMRIPNSDEFWTTSYLNRATNDGLPDDDLGDIKDLGFFDSPERVRLIFEGLTSSKLKVVLQYCLFHINEKDFLRYLGRVPNHRINIVAIKWILRNKSMGSHQYMRHVLLNFLD